MLKKFARDKFFYGFVLLLLVTEINGHIKLWFTLIILGENVIIKINFQITLL